MMRYLLCSLLLASVALAQPPVERRGCSNATLKGTYGFLISGTKPSGPPPAPLEAMIGTATTNFDGNGNLTQIDNIHSAISPLATDRPGTGSYSLNEDCSGVMPLIPMQGGPVLELRIVVVDNGREVRAVVMAPALSWSPATAGRSDQQAAGPPAATPSLNRLAPRRPS